MNSFFKKKFIKYSILVTIFIVLTLGIYIFHLTNSTINFYVSASGSDSNIGSKSYPFKTLDAARDAIRKMAKIQGINKNVNVYIRGGNYYMDKSFTMEKVDSPNKGFSIKYKAYKNENVCFIGGYNLPSSDFNELTDKSIINKLVNKNVSKSILVANLSKYNLNFDINKDNIIKASELFYNNDPMTLSRYPNDGFLYTKQVSTVSNKENNVYSFKYNDMEPSLWNEKQNIWMSGYWYHDWSDSTVKVSNLNFSNNLIDFTDKLPYGIKENQRYYFFNVLEELDKQGEYYIDYSKKLLYFIPNSPIKNSKIQLSKLTSPFIEMKDVSNITIEGINFENSKATEILIENGSKNIIKNCVLRNTSQFGIYIKGGTNNGIENCKVYNTGTGGIVINGGDRNNLTPCNNYASNNEIYNYSRIKRTYSAAINISGVGIIASHNSIHDAPHTAILFSGNDHLIEYNEIYDVAKETDDVGVIYTGRDWTFRGNIIRYNYLHDINNSIGKFNVSGIYLDDCMSSAKIYGNIFYKVKNPLFIGGGRDNSIVNNIIINCTNSINFDERGLKGNLGSLYSNLNAVPYTNKTWTTKYPELKYLFKDGNPGIPSNNIVENNILYKTKPPAIGNSIIKYGEVKDNILYNKDPGFINLDKMNFKLKKNSDVFNQVKNFKNIPFDDIGIKH